MRQKNVISDKFLKVPIDRDTRIIDQTEATL